MYKDKTVEIRTHIRHSGVGIRAWSRQRMYLNSRVPRICMVKYSSMYG